MAVENGTYSYMPSKQLTLFEKEISPLLSFLGDKNDAVLFEGQSNGMFEKFWHALGIELPSLLSKEALTPAQFNELFPWGWSQIIQHKYQSYSQNHSSLPRILKTPYGKGFFSRLTSYQLIKQLSEEQLHPFVSIPALPQLVNQPGDVEVLFRKHNNGIVLKTLWSSSGRGLLFIRNEKQLANSKHWVLAQIKKQGFLTGEPLYNKIQDASLQFNISSNGQYQFLGLNYFDADEQGRFSKEFFNVPDSIPEKFQQKDTWINETASSIINCLIKAEVHVKYTGPIGIDAMFIQHDNDLYFYPLVEANLRCNMGLVNLHLKKLISRQSKGTWQISVFKPKEALAFMNEHLAKYPVKLKDDKIEKGFLPLTPINEQTRFAAWALVC